MNKNKLKLFIPSEHKNTIYDIDFESFFNMGKKVILLDLDNTIEDYNHHHPNESIIELFKRIHEIGFKVLFVSNNGKKRLIPFSNLLNVEYLTHMGKPLTGKFKKYLKKTNLNLDESIFIGDQVVTDIQFSNKLNIYSILVNPIDRSTERWYTRINRFFENRRLKEISIKYKDKYEELKLNER